MRNRVVAAIAAGICGVVGLAVPAEAAKPAERACLGEFMSSAAKDLGVEFGQTVGFFAQNPGLLDIANLGEGIQNLLAGNAPAFPEACT